MIFSFFGRISRAQLGQSVVYRPYELMCGKTSQIELVTGFYRDDKLLNTFHPGHVTHNRIVEINLYKWLVLFMVKAENSSRISFHLVILVKVNPTFDFIWTLKHRLRRWLVTLDRSLRSQL